MLETIAHDLAGLMTPVLAICAFSIPLLDMLLKRRAISELITIIATLFTAISTSIIFMHVYISGNVLIYTYGGWPPHFGINYEIDLLNAILAMFTSWNFVAIVLYSLWYRHHIDEPVWYYVMLIGLLTGLIGCLYTGDAFNLFVMFEVLSISAYGLVAYHKNKPEALEAAAKYAILGAVATTMYFIAVIILYAIHGSVNMAILTGFARTGVPDSVKYASMISVSLALWAFTFKSALVPNHFWLPDAHPEAPTPVSAALSGLVVNIGAYATMRFLYTIFNENSYLSNLRMPIMMALFILGTLSGIIGGLMMMVQKDIKRLLAYSTICHMGIIYIGIAIGFAVNKAAMAMAMTGTVLHIMTHGIAKSLLFMSSGVFIDMAGSRDMDKMRGVGRKNLLVSVSFLIGFLSLAGLLPLAGFFSKLLIIMGYAESGFVLGGIMILVISALSLPGYFKAMYSVIFATSDKDNVQVSENPKHVKYVNTLLFAMGISLIILGLAYPLIQGAFARVAESIVIEEARIEYVNAVLRTILRIIYGGIQ
ncbi:MAG: proton-conducting transporter membrane subunit [Desulfurococcaceae archaeon]